MRLASQVSTLRTPLVRGDGDRTLATAHLLPGAVTECAAARHAARLVRVSVPCACHGAVSAARWGAARVVPVASRDARADAVVRATLWTSESLIDLRAFDAWGRSARIHVVCRYSALYSCETCKRDMYKVCDVSRALIRLYDTALYRDCYYRHTILLARAPRNWLLPYSAVYSQGLKLPVTCTSTVYNLTTLNAYSCTAVYM